MASARAIASLALCAFLSACAAPPQLDVRATVQAEVSGTVAAVSTKQVASATMVPPSATRPAVSSSTDGLPHAWATAAPRSGTTSAPATTSAVPSTFLPTGTTALDSRIGAILARLPAKHTAVVQGLVDEVRIDVDSESEVPAASTIKLPLMITAFDRIATGRLSRDQRFTVSADKVVGGAGVLQGQVGRTITTAQLIETTLRYSDNTGANMLLDALGGTEAVNAAMAQFGFVHTHMRRRLMDVQAEDRGLDNTTSASDLAEMLARIYRRDLIGSQASAEMLSVLELRGRETDPSLDYIARHFVPRPTVAHVNGTLDRVRNDAGIVEQQNEPFIFVALLHDQSNPTSAEEAIARSALEIAATLNAGG